MVKNTEKATFKGGKITLVGNEVKVGDKAPEFVALDKTLTPRKLSEFAGKTVVIVVYPSIDTPVCAAQNRKFNQEAANLGDVVILSISVDLPFAQTRFCAAEGIDKVITLSDHKELDFGYKYGFVIEELRLLSRGTVIVDKAGVVQFVEYVPEVTNEPDYAAALEVVKKLV
jgi:thioredoxin-dependent peroxiredoxin